MAILDFVNIAAMTAQAKAPLTDGQQALVSGHTVVNDGGGGTFYWHAGSSTAADGGTVFAPREGGTGRWKRIYSGPLNARWFGAKGDAATNDHTALQNCFTTAVASNQLAVHVPRGTYRLGQTLNISNVSLIGDGAVATTFQPLDSFTGPAVLLIDDNTGGGGGVDSLYQNFRIHGNRSSVSGSPIGLLLRGDVIYNQFSTVRINEVKGAGILFDTDGGGSRPSNNTFINVHVNAGDNDGLRINAGSHCEFIACAFENLAGRGINITGSSIEAGHMGFRNVYLENVQDTGIHIQRCSGILIDHPLVNGYGTSRSASYAVHVVDATQVKLVAGDYAKNTPAHANSRHVRVSGGFNFAFEQPGSQITGSELSIVSGGGFVVSNGFHIASTGMENIHFSNGRAAIGAGASAYLAPSTGDQSRTEADVRTPVSGRLWLGQIRFTCERAGGSETRTATVYKNGTATPLTATTAPGGGTATSNSPGVALEDGDTWSVLFTGTGGAASCPQDTVHLTVAVNR